MVNRYRIIQIPVLAVALLAGGLLNADTSVEANPPEATSYTLTVTDGTGSGSYTSGTVVAISATPAAGKVFSAWIGATTAVADAKASSTIVTMPAANATLTATFASAHSGYYTLSVVNGSGSGEYAAGSTVAVSAILPKGQIFSAWSGDTATMAYTTVSSTVLTMPSANIAITADPKDPAADTYTLAVVGGIGSGAYAVDKEVSIAAIVPAGKAFSKWAGDVSKVKSVYSASTSIVMPSSNSTVAAVFKDAPSGTYTLTLVNGTGSGAYTAGSSVAIKAGSAPSGQEFASWTGDTAGVAKTTSSSTTVTMPSANITIGALFAALKARVSLNISPAGAGTTTPLDAVTTAIAPNSSIDITATAASGYVFSSWSAYPTTAATFVDAASAATTATCSADCVITAKFAKDGATMYTLTVASGSGTHDYYLGDSATVSADASVDTAKVFTGWSGYYAALAGPTTSRTTLTSMPPKSVSVTATYAAAPTGKAMLTVTNGTGGGVYAKGASVAVAAGAASAGQVFDKWIGDTSYLASSTSAATTVTMPASGISITAAYKLASRATATLAVDSSPASAGTLSPAAGGYDVRANVAMKIAAVPNDGFLFLKWIIADAATASVKSAYAPSTWATFLADGKVTAKFAAKGQVTGSVSFSSGHEEGFMTAKKLPDSPTKIGTTDTYTVEGNFVLPATFDMKTVSASTALEFNVGSITFTNTLGGAKVKYFRKDGHGYAAFSSSETNPDNGYKGLAQKVEVYWFADRTLKIRMTGNSPSLKNILTLASKSGGAVSGHLSSCAMVFGSNTWVMDPAAAIAYSGTKTIASRSGAGGSYDLSSWSVKSAGASGAAASEEE